MSKKSGLVSATFHDAGTDETFEGGKEHSFEAGAYANYAAAGLIEPVKPKVPAKTASARKPSAKRKASPTKTPAETVLPPAPSDAEALPSA